MRSLNKDYGNKIPLFHQKNHQNRYYQPIDTKAKRNVTGVKVRVTLRVRQSVFATQYFLQ